MSHDSPALPADVRLLQLLFGGIASRAVGVAVQLRLADVVKDAERTVSDVAAACDADVDSMRRLLRALAALGLCDERDRDVFALTELGALLRTDRADSSYDFARLFTDPTLLHAWDKLDVSVRTGRTAFDEVFGVDFFSYLAENPELSTTFNAAMSQGSRHTADLLPQCFDFGRFTTVVDVGGGDGTLLAAALRADPELRGIVFDTESGSADAATELRAQGVAERGEVRTGDFFAAVPEGADLYVLKSVLHDWDDQRCETILRCCRAAMPPHGRVLIVEPLLPSRVDGSQSEFAYLSDLNMMAYLNGRERTGEDFTQLAQRSGFDVVGIDAEPLGGLFALIELKPA